MTRFRFPPADSGSQLSESQRDWAYEKRALARGLREEEVPRNIAEFRAQDKYDPQHYARRTELRRKSTCSENRESPPKSIYHDWKKIKPSKNQRNVP
jgi:hypothetical protein